MKKFCARLKLPDVDLFYDTWLQIIYNDDEITWMKYGLKKENFDDERRAGKRKRAAGYALRRCMGPAGGRAGVL